MSATEKFRATLDDMDAKGIGMSMRVGDGPMIPLNKAAAGSEQALKDKIGDALEEAFPGQVVRDAAVPKRRMAREPSDTPLPLGDTTSRKPPDDRLRLLIERVERLEEEKKGIADDVKDVFAEIKAVGYDTKIVKQVIKLRAMQPADRREMESLLDVYKAAVGLD